MHAVPVELRLELASDAARAARLERRAADRTDAVTAELNRWITFLAVPFVLSAIFFMGAIGTGREWLIGGALVTGPGLLLAAFIYLSLSSDTTGSEEPGG
jgi:hypothetical protein